MTDYLIIFALLLMLILLSLPTMTLLAGFLNDTRSVARVNSDRSDSR